MSLEDPFLIVQNEVFDAFHKLSNNFTRWTELQTNDEELSRKDYMAFVTELKNGLKSIQWDLDELEESLENSERSTNLDEAELEKRRAFIKQTRDEVNSMNEQLIKNQTKIKKPDYAMNFGSQQLQQGTKYYRLINEPESSIPKTFDDENEHSKSPYATTTNHSLTMDEADDQQPNVAVISQRHNKLDVIKQYWSSLQERHKVLSIVVGSILLVMLVFFLW